MNYPQILIELENLRSTEHNIGYLDSIVEVLRELPRVSDTDSRCKVWGALARMAIDNPPSFTESSLCAVMSELMNNFVEIGEQALSDEWTYGPGIQ